MIVEFTLEDEQAAHIEAEAEPGQQLIGSLQRYHWPHRQAGQWYFSGRWCSTEEVERMRKAAGKPAKKRRSK